MPCLCVRAAQTEEVSITTCSWGASRMAATAALLMSRNYSPSWPTGFFVCFLFSEIQICQLTSCLNLLSKHVVSQEQPALIFLNQEYSVINHPAGCLAKPACWAHLARTGTQRGESAHGEALLGSIHKCDVHVTMQPCHSSTVPRQFVALHSLRRINHMHKAS